jgi:hypothetical protein
LEQGTSWIETNKNQSQRKGRRRRIRGRNDTKEDLMILASSPSPSLSLLVMQGPRFPKRTRPLWPHSSKQVCAWSPHLVEVSIAQNLGRLLFRAISACVKQVKDHLVHLGSPQPRFEVCPMTQPAPP